MKRTLSRSIFFLLFAGIIIISGCSQKETRVVIFHTNDTHSNLSNLPVLAWLVNREREKEQHVLLVSAGDIFSGNPMVDNYDPPGYPKIDLMNRLGYDVNTIGNHEFDYGPDMLRDRMEQAGFPFILANIDTEGSVVPQPDPWYIARAGRRTIAFLGLVQLNSQGIPSAHPDNLKGFRFYPPVEKAGEFSYLAGKADAVIALTHHGFSSDTLMAWRYPWIDLIIGGHSHTLTLEPRTYNGIYVTHAGANLQYAGKVSLVFRGRELVEINAEMISLRDVPGRDEEVAALVEEYNDNPVLNRVIGRLSAPIEGKPDLGSFITDIYREFGNFDFAFHNYGGIRVNRLEGEIRIKDLFQMDPFGNELVSMQLTYGELQSLIGNSLSSRNEPSVQISGGIIEVHVTDDNQLKEVKVFDNSGNELEYGKRYLSGMPSYMASAFDFKHDDPGTGMGIVTAQVVINHVSKHRDIDFEGSERSRIIRHD